jgi:hypothetical protein
MARTKKPASPTVEALRPYLEGVAKKLADDLWGPAGPAWGTTLTEIEDVILETRDILARQVLQLGLQRQATTPAGQRPAEYRHCPACRGVLPAAAAEPPPRQVDTRAGAAHWQEPQTYCPRCRRAFFPSEQEPGD